MIFIIIIIIIIIFMSRAVLISIHTIGDQSTLLDSFALQLFYCFAFWKFWIHTIWNESFEFFLGKCQRVMGLWEWEWVRQQLWKIKELVTFSVSFPLLFYTILDDGSQSYWIDWSVLFSFLFFNLFLVLFSISSPESLVGVIKAAMPLQ